MPYDTNDPKGWNGDPAAGAAHGRPALTTATPTGTIYIQEIELDEGGYDHFGTYWGLGTPLFFVEGQAQNGETYERTVRASGFLALKERMLAEFPNNTIERLPTREVKEHP